MARQNPVVTVIEVVQKDAEQSAVDLPAIIFFHGRGLNPDSVSQILPAFGASKVLAPDGGIPCRGGTTWFENERIGVAKPESVIAAESRFLGWRRDFLGESTRTWLCGFSNGGAFAAHLLMHHPELFLGAALLSAPLVLPPWIPNRLRGKPVFYGRGTSDEIVPADAFERAEQYLGQQSGSAATLRKYKMAHEICDAEVSDLQHWLTARNLDLLN